MTNRKERLIAIGALLEALEDHHTGERRHAERVTVYAVATGEAMGLSDDELDLLHDAAMLHDLGKLTLNSELLAKRGMLSPEDRRALESHVDPVDHLDLEEQWMAELVGRVRAHHERFDGSGYPDGLKGDQIPLESRIISVAEVFDTLAFGAVWKEAMGEDAAAQELSKYTGTWFDPTVVHAFLKVQPLIQPIVA